MAATAPERAADYHKTTGFSSTLARAMVTRTPAHAHATVSYTHLTLPTNREV